MIAIIGGSGFESFDGFVVKEKLEVETPFGAPSTGLKRVLLDGKEVLFLSRHGENHELTPSEINYRANIFALKKAGTRGVVSVSAVGSLKAEHAPGNLVIPLQFFDRTKGVRKSSFCGEGVVGHVSLAHPVCEAAAKKVFEAARALKVPASLGGTYVCMEGPQFSTYAESIHYRSLGGDVIGMTNFPEVALAREAGMTYLPLSFVTDYDCWDTSRPHVTLEEVVRIMRGNNEKAYTLLKELVKKEDLLQGCECGGQGLKAGLMTDFNRLTPNQQEWMRVLQD
jgi:5'-methylthioadenosine phosphorylase